MLGNIASYNVPDEILLFMVQSLYSVEEKCVSVAPALMRQTIQFECIPVEFVVRFIRSVCSKSCTSLQAEVSAPLYAWLSLF